MREIKFRAWNKERDEMYCLNNHSGIKNIELSMYGEINIIELFEYLPDGNFAFVSLNKDEVELMQYTGLKDKNGVEIYEGDIVDSKYRWEVIFKNGCFLCKSNIDKTDIKTLGQILNLRRKVGCESEVIGNIYENPELLGENK